MWWLLCSQCLKAVWPSVFLPANADSSGPWATAGESLVLLAVTERVKDLALCQDKHPFTLQVPVKNTVDTRRKTWICLLRSCWGNALSGPAYGTSSAVGAAPASCPTQHAAAQELKASMSGQSRKGKAECSHPVQVHGVVPRELQCADPVWTNAVRRAITAFSGLDSLQKSAVLSNAVGRFLHESTPT